MSRELPGHVAVVGLGYVGLQVATAFGRLLPTVGFDVDSKRIEELRVGYDRNADVSSDALKGTHLIFSDSLEALWQADFFIVAVPTPVDSANRPDLSHIREASRLVGQVIGAAHRKPKTKKHPPIIVYESTVYPGCMDEVCIPVLERESGMLAGRGFIVGYSPERISPGDSERGLDKVVKVVAAQDQKAVDMMARMYGLVVPAGTYKAPDIRTAEAAKVIENVQRDLNIALMNELAMLFHHLGLDTHAVLKVAQTKWNFLPFEPGLVGGHCIPVDPYYLTYRAQEVGYQPEMILAGRRINDTMGVYVAHETVKLLVKAGRSVGGARVLVLGVAFKEDVRDVRNSQVVRLVRELESYGIQVQVHDPLVKESVLSDLDLKPILDPFADETEGKFDNYEAIVLAVPHQAFREMGLPKYLALMRTEDGPGVLVDVKGALSCEPGENPDVGVIYWRL